MERLLDYLEWDRVYDTEKELITKASMANDIVIFGAGIGGGKTFTILKNGNLDSKVIFFSDNNVNKIGRNYCHRMCISPSEIVEKTSNNRMVIISSTAYDVISSQLMEYGISKDEIFFFQMARMEDAETEKNFIKEHIDHFTDIYNELIDEKSKFIFRSLLNYRLTKDVEYLNQMSVYIDLEENQYFDKNLLDRYMIKTGFVDVGAYSGDTLLQLHNKMPEFTGKCFAFEAGEQIYNRLVESVNNAQYGFNTELYNIAVWDHEGWINFEASENEAGSKIVDEGIKVRCDSLDNILLEKNELIDFIKMDIEGAERKALEGSKEIIKKNKPILAICIYHKKEDFFDIPELIKSIEPYEYDFYIRQYRFGQSETVLYAMPKSRKKVRE